MAERPTGTVTFLFTDVEGSTRLWEETPDEMQVALERHDEILRSAIELHRGYVFSTAGDAFAAAFDRPEGAVAAAVAAQQGLAVEVWPEKTVVRVRMGLHTGEAQERGGDYFGPVLNRAARVMSAGHGGQILVAASTSALLSDIEVRDLGTHRLKDLSDPEHLFQVVGAGLSTEFAPLRTVDAVAGNLPAQLSSFIGRKDEVSELVELIRRHRLVTLTGVGGVGKTRLAVQVAAESVGDFSGGVWVVELAPVGDPDAVPDAVAAVLGVTVQAGRSVTDSIADAVAGREMLIVVDNCEHVLDAAVELLEVLLSRAPAVKVIATSREGLRVGAEQLWSVPSLSLRGGSESAAVELFGERARSVVSGFGFEDEAALAAVMEICTRLDGIPLAIELAAARMMSMTPVEVRDRLDDRFRLLSGSRRGLERHQTLRHAVAWSYDLLDDDERRLLNRSSVFADGFDLDAITDICGFDEIVDEYIVLDRLDSLVRKSLVSVSRSGGHARYELLETIRQFAEDQLIADGTVDQVRQRHGAYFATQATLRFELWKGPGFRASIDWLDVEFGNLRAGFGWAAAHSDFDTAAAIAAHAVPLAFARQRFETIGWAAEILEAATAADVAQLPRLYASAACCFWIGPPEIAVDRAQTAVALEAVSRYDSFEPGWASFIEYLAQIYAGRLERAVEIIAAVAKQTGGARVYGLAGLTAVLEASGAVQAARDVAEEAVAVAREHSNPFFITFALWAYGSAFAQVDPKRALVAWREGLACAREHRISYFEGFIARDAASIDIADRDPLDGLELFDTAIGLFHEAGNVVQLVITLDALRAFFERADLLESAANLHVAIAGQPGSALLVPNLPEVGDRLRAALGSDLFDQLISERAGLGLSDATRYARQQIQVAEFELRPGS